MSLSSCVFSGVSSVEMRKLASLDTSSLSLYCMVRNDVMCVTMNIFQVFISSITYSSVVYQAGG